MKKRRHIKGVSKKRKPTVSAKTAVINPATGKDQPRQVFTFAGTPILEALRNGSLTLQQFQEAYPNSYNEFYGQLTQQERAILTALEVPRRESPVRRTRRPVTNEQLDALQRGLLTGSARPPGVSNNEQEEPWEEAESPLSPLEEDVPPVGSGSFQAEIDRAPPITSPEEARAFSQRMLSLLRQGFPPSPPPDRIIRDGDLPPEIDRPDWAHSHNFEVNNLARDIESDKKAAKERRRNGRRLFVEWIKEHKTISIFYLICITPSCIMLLFALLDLLESLIR